MTVRLSVILSLVAASAALTAFSSQAGAVDLTGRWLFLAETGEGQLAASLDLTRADGKVLAKMEIDRHVLEGRLEGNAGGFTMELRDQEAPADSAHQHRLSLRGKLIGDRPAGKWDDGTSQGTWTARRQ